MVCFGGSSAASHDVFCIPGKVCLLIQLSTSMPCITDAHTKLCTKPALPCTRTDLVFFQSFARAYRQLTHKIFSALRKLIRQVLVVRVAVCLKNGAPAIQDPITPVWIILSCQEYYQQGMTIRQQNEYIYADILVPYTYIWCNEKTEYTQYGTPLVKRRIYRGLPMDQRNEPDIKCIFFFHFPVLKAVSCIGHK